MVAVAWRALFAFRPSGRSQTGLVNEVVTTIGASPVAWLTQEPLVNTVVLAAALVWVAAGKTSAEIGDILGSRPRTIEKHLERIYGKLGVETRTAAAAFVTRPGGLAV